MSKGRCPRLCEAVGGLLTAPPCADRRLRKCGTRGGLEELAANAQWERVQDGAQRLSGEEGKAAILLSLDRKKGNHENERQNALRYHLPTKRAGLQAVELD